uniref:Uncharacterized protein n=1 Tax=Plectus sambesii TaxID=2011161 RepID=A0A914WQG9_9BILA
MCQENNQLAIRLSSVDAQSVQERQQLQAEIDAVDIRFKKDLRSLAAAEALDCICPLGIAPQPALKRKREGDDEIESRAPISSKKFPEPRPTWAQDQSGQQTSLRQIVPEMNKLNNNNSGKFYNCSLTNSPSYNRNHHYNFLNNINER